MSYGVNDQPIELPGLFKLSGRFYWAVLKNTALYFLLLAIIKDVGLFYSLPAHHSWVVALISSLRLFLCLFLFAVSLYAAHQAMVKKTSLRQDCSFFFSVLRAFFWFSVLLLIIVTSIILVLYIAFLALHFFYHIPVNMSAHASYTPGILAGVMLLGFIVNYILVRLFFVLPILLLTPDSLWVACQRSSELVNRYMVRVFMMLAYLILVYALSGDSTILAHYLNNYYLNIPLDFILFAITLPFFFVVCLLLFEDLKLRARSVE